MPLKLAEPFCVTDSVLHDIMFSCPTGIHIKDAKTGHYLDGNQALMDFFDLRDIKDLLGFSVLDIDKFMRPYWGLGYAQRVAELDRKVVASSASQKNLNEIMFDTNNLVYIQDLIKIPLAGQGNRVKAILTIFTNKTQETDPFTLLNIYTKMYDNPSIGIKNFMRFLKLTDFFQEDLTYKEIICLMHMLVKSDHKIVAKKLNISIRTVETHASHITKKLKSGDITTVLTHLRSRKI